ncbi:MAG TPA: putative PEP-binding protein, partial [Burkholderiales bacterium]|nr:putative PEP-binding protein [Burkholderiales bacterium]
ADFFAIGTNDLIQYTLAIDRTDEAVAHLYDPLHPAILKLLSMVIGGANKAGIPVALCGEMAGDVTLTRLLLALGLRNFSMHSAHLPDVKQCILNTDIGKLTRTARQMLRADDPMKLLGLLARLNR